MHYESHMLGKTPCAHRKIKTSYQIVACSEDDKHNNIINI